MDWDSLYADPKMCLTEPAEEVLRILPLLRERGVRRVHDLGYGAGRHVVYLAQHGLELYGTDISPRGQELTEKWLAQEGLSAELKLSDMTVVPYGNDFFDACICRGVITHNTLANIQLCVSEVYRSLVPGGIFLCTFISTESSLFGQGEEVEPNTFRGDDGLEKDVLHHFMTEDEVREVTKAFVCLELKHFKHEGLIDTGLPYVSAHWVFVGEKPVAT